MTTEQIFYLLFSLFGLASAIKFRSLGRSTIEKRKKLNEIFASPRTKVNFNKTDVTIEQIMGLVIGIIFFIVGLVKFLTLFK